MTLQNGKNNLTVKSVAKYDKTAASEDDVVDLDSAASETKVGQEIFVMTFDFTKQLDLNVGNYRVNIAVVDSDGTTLEWDLGNIYAWFAEGSEKSNQGVHP